MLHFLIYVTFLDVCRLHLHRGRWGLCWEMLLNLWGDCTSHFHLIHCTVCQILHGWFPLLKIASLWSCSWSEPVTNSLWNSPFFIVKRGKCKSTTPLYNSLFLFQILYRRVNFQIYPEGGENTIVSPLISKALQEVSQAGREERVGKVPVGRVKWG